MTPQHEDLLRHAIVSAVEALGSQGTPGNVLCAALMENDGCSLEQYETIMSVLVKVGKLTRRGQLYFAVAPISTNIGE